MPAFSPSEPFYDAGYSDSLEESAAPEYAQPTNEPADPAVGKGCAEALVKRGFVGEAHKSYVAALITQVNNDAVAAVREMLRQTMIERSNEAVVAEFIKRTVRRRAWGVERPVAVGRLAHNFHQRRQAAAFSSRQPRPTESDSQS